ncbi:MAG TPA: TIM barrel protein [Gemmataceae bacterium]|nr:TIM barrel protein [Gemmataceae bacterium]
MKDPWQPYLQLGIVHFMAFPECLTGEGPLFDTLCTICDDPFFDAVDVGPMYDAGQRRECAALLRDSQMSVTFACQPLQLTKGLDLNAADREQRQQAVEAIVGLLDQAKELGASRFGLMSGKNVPPAERAAAQDRLIGELLRICKAARDRAGLPVVLEIFDHDVDKKALVGPCATAAAVARAVRNEFPDFGLLHDLSHIYLCHETPEKHFPLIREHLVAVHLGNSVSDPKHPMYGDTHPLFGMAGSDSDVPQLRDFLRVLFDIGFLRPLTPPPLSPGGEGRYVSSSLPPGGRGVRGRPVCAFEIRTPAGVRPQTAIANMKRTWQQAWWTL